ncbi:hypothetical protein M1Q08_14245 [Klebsiella pneumoniae]|uniref:hypothetical protein n=1 Tax=Klebsiella pneumoniae TaxID=573 RepID=UPI0023644C35|nr:hypothetical protein [Klebsiella pneumoniae]MDD1934177.1 hypothetical protein [Klebsiella pneumoniae]
MNFAPRSIFTKTENIKFLSARKRHLFSYGYWQYNRQFLSALYITQDLRPIMLGIFLMGLLNGLSNKPDLAQKKGYKSTNKQKLG